MLVFKNDLIGVNIVQNDAVGHIIYSLQPQLFSLFSLMKSICYKLVEILRNIKVQILYQNEFNKRSEEVLIFKHFWLVLVIVLVSNVIVYLGRNLNQYFVFFIDQRKLVHYILKDEQISNHYLLSKSYQFKAVFNGNNSGNYIKSVYNYTKGCSILAFISLKY